MKSFELQVYRQGTWKTESIYDDRGLAELEARRMEQSSKHGNLRIIEEIYDQKTDKTKIRTIYRDKKYQENVTQKTKLKTERMTGTANNKFRNGNYNTGRRPKEKPKTNMTVILLKLAMIGFLGIAGMVALQFIRVME